MSYDHWKTTNPEDEFLGAEPPPCLPQRTAVQPFALKICADCGAPEGQCWWEDAPPDDETSNREGR